MTRLIGLRWTRGDAWSREVLIVRGLAIIFLFSSYRRSQRRNLSARRLPAAMTRTAYPRSGPHTHGKQSILGDDSAGDTPLPIPNRVVKPTRADGTATPSGRVCRRRSFLIPPEFSGGIFFCRIRTFAGTTTPDETPAPAHPLPDHTPHPDCPGPG